MFPGRGHPLPPGAIPGQFPNFPGMPMGMPHFPMGRPPPPYGIPGMMHPGFAMGMHPPHMMPGMMPPMFVPPPMAPTAPPALSVPPGSILAASAAPTVAGSLNLAQTTMHPTSYALNRHIFTNAHAGLPLSLFIVNIPLDFEDAKLARMLEACGKTMRYLRPVDPISEVPSSFALVTYAQALCALRALNLLNDFCLDEIQGSESPRLQIKLGVKEQLSLDSLQQTEQEAAAQLPPDMALEDVYAPMRRAVQAAAHPPPPLSLPSPAQNTEAARSLSVTKDEGMHGAGEGEESKPLETDLKGGEVEEGEVSGGDASGGPVVLTGDSDVGDGDTTVTPSGNRLEIYKTILGSGGEETEEDKKEAILLGEVGRFRLRQMERDRLLEEQKREKIKQRIKQLQDAKNRAQQEAQRVGSQTADLPAAEAPAEEAARRRRLQVESEESNNADRKRRLDEEEEANPEEAEAKRRRKLQVLQMLSEDTSLLPASIAALTPSSNPKAPSSFSFKLKTGEPKAVGPVSGVAAGPVGPEIKKRFGGILGEEEEDDLPRRQLTLLSYTEEELAGESGAQFSIAGEIGQQEDDGDEVLEDEGMVGNKKKKGVKKNPGVAASAAGFSLGTVIGVGGGAGGGMSIAGGLNVSAIEKMQANARAISQRISQQLVSATTGGPVSAAGNGTDLGSKIGEDRSKDKEKEGALEAVQEAKESLKKIVDQIPSSKALLYSFPVNWELLDNHDVVRQKLAPWISRKVAEYLGEAEDSLNAFIVSKLMAHSSAEEIRSELEVVLEEDAEGFVAKLWRMLVYYSLLLEGQ